MHELIIISRDDDEIDISALMPQIKGAKLKKKSGGFQSMGNFTYS